MRDAGGSKGFFNYFTSNQGDARHYGAEYHSQWSFNPDWSLETNLSLLKATMDNSSRDLATAPECKYDLLITSLLFFIIYLFVHSPFENLNISILSAYDLTLNFDYFCITCTALYL